MEARLKKQKRALKDEQRGTVFWSPSGKGCNGVTFSWRDPHPGERSEARCFPPRQTQQQMHNNEETFSCLQEYYKVLFLSQRSLNTFLNRSS